MNKILSMTLAGFLLAGCMGGKQYHDDMRKDNMKKHSMEAHGKMLKDIVSPLYARGFTVTANPLSDAELNALFTEDFQSIGGGTIKTKAMMIGALKGMPKMIPNMKWEPQEVLVSGNQVIVRSKASGNPTGDFFGLKLNGQKAFDIMTIDIHTINEKGQISKIYHVEEWAGAMQQLSSKK